MTNIPRKLNQIFLKGTLAFSVIIILTACQATTSLVNDPSMDGNTRRIALKIAEKSKDICATYTYEQGSNQRLSGNMRFAKTPDVKRIFNSKEGWWRAELMISGVWDNVYYKESTETLICGELLWQTYPLSSHLLFNEVKHGILTSEVSTQNTPINTNTQKIISNRWSIAFSWDGYSELLSGIVNIDTNKTEGYLSLNLPGDKGSCTGRYQLTDGINGIWALSCTNGLSGTGRLNGTREISGSTGIGNDASNRTIKFTIGERI
jgi:hypothetical protein